MYARLVAGAVIAVMLLAHNLFLKADPLMAIKPLMRDTLPQLAEGFSEPALLRAVVTNKASGSSWSRLEAVASLRMTKKVRSSSG